MGTFYRLAPREVYNLYLQCVREHNRPELEPAARHDEMTRSTAILDVVRVVWGSVAAGDIIAAGDMAAGCMEHDRPMCGGMLRDLEPA